MTDVVVWVVVIILIVVVGFPQVLPGTSKKKRKCPHCQTEISLAAKVCPACGRNVPESYKLNIRGFIAFVVVLGVVFVLYLTGVLHF